MLSAVSSSGRRDQLPPRSPSRTQQASQPPSPQQQGQGQAQQQGQQQYLRLPVESAKKLRWFDRQDINSECWWTARMHAWCCAVHPWVAAHWHHFFNAEMCGSPHFLAVLMQLHLREKQELFEANAALRTVLRRQGVPDAQLEAEVKRINTQVGAGQLSGQACRSCIQ